MDSSRDASLQRPWQNGDVVAGRYEVLDFIGAGGMGLVYRCRDLQTSRIRALKTLRLDLEPEQREVVLRLLRSEATALRRIESDFVVRIFDANVEAAEAAPFVVMELLRGRDLEQVLKTARPSRTQALAWLWQAACGLKVIHAEGIVHRDLKPANLFLNERDDGSTELKILDFSISRLLDSVTGRTTIIVGTKGFMSPEQAAGYDVDHRSDIFSLGQVAHALLEPSDAFREWHRKATAPDRRERFSSAVEAVEKLALALGVVLPGKSSQRPSDAVLSSATTVFATSGHARKWLPWAFVFVGAAAALVVTVLMATRHDRNVDGAHSAAAQPSLPSVAASVAPAVVVAAPLASADATARPVAPAVAPSAAPSVTPARAKAFPQLKLVSSTPSAQPAPQPAPAPVVAPAASAPSSTNGLRVTPPF